MRGGPGNWSLQGRDCLGSQPDGDVDFPEATAVLHDGARPRPAMRPPIEHRRFRADDGRWLAEERDRRQKGRRAIGLALREPADRR